MVEVPIRRVGIERRPRTEARVRPSQQDGWGAFRCLITITGERYEQDL